MNVIQSPSDFFSKLQIPIPEELQSTPGKRKLNIPTEFWLTKGFGESNTSLLSSFDYALINARIGHVNLIPYSSIIPKFAKFLPGEINIFPGSQTGVIIATQSGKKNDAIISGLAIGECKDYFVVYEIHEKNKSLKEVQEVLLRSIKKAIEIRGGNLKDVFLTIHEKRVSAEYGTIISAIVFNPTTYL